MWWSFTHPHFVFCRILKMTPASFSVVRLPATYPKGTLRSPSSLQPRWDAILSILPGSSLLVQDVRTIEVLACLHSFSASC